MIKLARELTWLSSKNGTSREEPLGAGHLNPGQRMRCEGVRFDRREFTVNLGVKEEIHILFRYLLLFQVPTSW